MSKLKLQGVRLQMPASNFVFSGLFVGLFAMVATVMADTMPFYKDGKAPTLPTATTVVASANTCSLDSRACSSMESSLIKFESNERQGLVLLFR